MGFWDGKSREEDEAQAAYEQGQKDGSEDRSPNFWYSTTMTNETEATAYEAGHDNGRANQPKS